MTVQKTTFALFFGNRGFFPAALIEGARADLPRVLRELGHGALMLDKNATRHGAVETPREGAIYAEFLRRNRGKFGGVILALPNFGDETGAVAALKDCGVPILVQAYPDELDKMGPALRRDAFCGKISIMDVFCQNNVKFTALKPHTVSPLSEEFKLNVDYFDRVCRVVRGLKNLVVGAIGARTTPFKTVRFDELALQKAGITVETLDLTQVFAGMEKIAAGGKAYRAKAAVLREYACWDKAPKAAFDKLVRLGVVLDEIRSEYQLDALAIRCWTEMQSLMGISPCVVMSELNNRGIATACEVDVGNAITMQALALASDGPAACLDWNNNYAEDEEKCILFHCGPVPADLMQGKGTISDHLIIANALGKGKGFGCNTGRIAPGDCTFGSMITEAGRLKFYLGQGRFTNDPIPPEFFGCAGVVEIAGLQDVLLHIGRNGYRHHVSVAGGHILMSVREALENYLGFQVAVPQPGL
ncbi:MAG: hypothetical protein HYV35_03305 [Lentisphaerae bacterium]|nr:hypothetical protein [Lentisphaerota bacterium]